MFYVGDQCTIVTRRHGHGFAIGERVEVVQAHYGPDGTGGSYRLQSLEDPSTSRWSVTDEEIELIEQLDEAEVQAAIESIKRAQQ